MAHCSMVAPPLGVNVDPDQRLATGGQVLQAPKFQAEAVNNRQNQRFQMSADFFRSRSGRGKGLHVCLKIQKKSGPYGPPRSFVTFAAGPQPIRMLQVKDGAGDGSRTRDTKLGKLVLYQLSYARKTQWVICSTTRNLSSGNIQKSGSQFA